jgi:hypothetical protein
MKNIFTPLFLFLSINLMAADTQREIHYAVEAGPIYWTANEEGQGFAYQVNGNVESVDMPYNFGFKTLIGGYWGNTLFNMNARYTRYTTSQSKSVSGVGSELVPLWATEGSSFSSLTSAYGKNSLNFNTLDLELGFNFNYDQVVLGFRPHIGLKGDIIHQKYSVNYLEAGNSADMKQSELIHGIGIRGGLDIDYEMVQHLSLIAGIAAATIWHDVHLTRMDYNNGLKTLNTKQKILEVDPVIEALIGLCYNTHFQEKIRFRAALCFENQVFFNISHWIALTNPQSTSSLSLMGGTLLLKLEY